MRRRLDTPPSSEPLLERAFGDIRSNLDDIDLSPPRQRRRHRLDTPPSSESQLERSLGDKQSNLDTMDLSPPRQRRRRLETFPSSNLQLEMRARDKQANLEDIDLSPPRQRWRCLGTPPSSMPQLENNPGEEAINPVVLVQSIRRMSKKEELKSKEKKKEEKPIEWGKGLKQKQEAEERAIELELEKDRPFARSRDDPELDKLLKERIRWGDPMAHLVKQKQEAEERAIELELEKDRPFARSRDDPELDKLLKERIRWGDPMAHLVKRKTSEPILEDLGGNDKMKESGFIIPQTIPSHSWLKRGLDFPPNRYGIRPGRHWDGVDRSNGYEKELFLRQNEKKAAEGEAYLWSVSEM
ncbi:hypothetical protein HPP92_019697 [Vanilla planifolia]|uniref:BUD13 homolog n=1 Tax=Vanilla planifolia TaxID=51239 RepID=A0A835UL69_VANPL|nr:hypothetical protein HPP92_019697 [Vanilla planifolia]